MRRKPFSTCFEGLVALFIIKDGVGPLIKRLGEQWVGNTSGDQVGDGMSEDYGERKMQELFHVCDIPFGVKNECRTARISGREFLQTRR
jgi:hypothetical protein